MSQVSGVQADAIDAILAARQFTLADVEDSIFVSRPLRSIGDLTAEEANRYIVVWRLDPAEGS